MPLTRDQKKHAAELLNLLDLLKRHVDKHIRPPFDLGFEEVSQWHQRVTQAEEYLFGVQNLAHELCAEPRELLDFLVDIESFADVHALAPELEPESRQEEASDEGAEPTEEAEDQVDTEGSEDAAETELAAEGADAVEEAEPANDDAQAEDVDATQEAVAESEETSEEAATEAAEEDTNEDTEEEFDPQERFEQMCSELVPALTSAMQRLGEWVREERDEHFHS